MLLDYDLDTKEEDVVPRSLELRKRIAARRIAEGISNGFVDQDLILKLKKISINEINVQKQSNIDVLNAESGLRNTQERAAQQLDIESSLHLLDRDLQRTSRLSRTRLDALSDIEKRIIHLRQNLSSKPNLPTVPEQISKELIVNNSLKLDKLFTICTRCERKILRNLFDAHDIACEKIKGNFGSMHNTKPAVYNPQQDLLTAITTFVPQPPRNFKFVKRGCTYIDFVWEPPVFDGGLPIYEYEIDYKQQLDIFNKETKLWTRRIEPMTMVKTSMWCLRGPICSNQYRLKNLVAGYTYVDFRVRAYNVRGCGNFCNLINETSITMEAPDAPTQPLFFQTDKITSSCIHFSWSPPIFDGGVPISGYRISYVVLERLFLATSSTKVQKKPNTVKANVKHCSIDGNTVRYVIHNLPHNTKIIDITIKAVNSAGLVGEETPLLRDPEFRMTSEGSMFKKYMFEIRRVESLKTEYVDSDFYNNTTQRLKRLELIKKLKSEFSHVKVDPEEAVEQELWDKIYADKMAKKAALKKAEADEAEELRKLQEAEMKSEELDDKSSHAFPYHIRKKHFKYKIKKLEQQIKDTNKERQMIDAERIDLTLFLRERQKFLMDVALEKQRVKDFRAPIISSSVLRGTSMNYYVESFKTDLINAYAKCQVEMTDAKGKIIKGEKRKIVVKALLERLEYEYNYRRASFKLFETEHENAMKTLNGMKGLAGAGNSQIVKYFFQKLKEFTTHKIQTKVLVGRLLNNIAKKYLSAAFTKWHTGEHLKTSSDKHAFISAGSLMLQQAKEFREDIQRQLREAIAETFDVKQKLDIGMIPKYQRNALQKSTHFPIMSESKAPSAMEMEGMHYLFEADGFVLSNKYLEAASLYEAQIMFLRSMAQINIKYLAICYGRLGKLFLRSEKYDRAIVEFDRQLSLSKEINDIAESADAYYGMGSGYVGRAEFHEAIRYLDIAHTQYGILNHKPHMCGVKIILKECYTRLNRPDLVAPLVTQIDSLENELKNKLKKIGDKLTEMGNKLIQSSAEIEFIVTLERANIKIIYLRNNLKELEAIQEAKEEETKGQREKIEEAGAFLGFLQAELVTAIKTDDKEMFSRALDPPQLLDVEELKVRLNELKLKKIEEFGELEKEENRMKTELKNLFDNITALNEEFEVETGILMTRCKHDRPFRCVAFNPMNAAGDEVTGLATGGVEYFAGADGREIHVMGYHGGGLEHIFQGDERGRLGEKKGHIGVVTCLAYDNNQIYSGSVDEDIMVWDVPTKERIRVMSGHEGTVVCLAIDGPLLCSGGADTTIRIWDKLSGEQIRILQGHIESVLTIEIGPDWLLTGSQDEEVRLWSLKWKSKITLEGDTTARLIGHECPVTCVKYGTMEVVSGDKKGRIFVWLVSTGEILRKCYVHTGQVKAIQFDATRIVSGGADGNVCITDIGTGSVVQTLRGHVGCILNLSFDTQRLISVGRDNKLRYWQWGKKSDAPPDKFHVMDKGETLVQIAKLHNVDVPSLLKWNGILEMRMCVPGMRLIVAKGDPTKLTHAELVAEERQHRKNVGLAYSKKSQGSVKTHAATLDISYNRLHRKAVDIDSHSLGNRMFLDAKNKMELFPDMVPVGRDPNSLASRLERNGGESMSLNARTRGQANSVFITVDNEEQWGPISDALGTAMLEMFVEFEAFAILIEEQRNSRDPMSVIGRIHNPKTLQTKAMLTRSTREKNKKKLQRIVEKKDDEEGNPDVLNNQSNSISENVVDFSQSEDVTDAQTRKVNITDVIDVKTRKVNNTESLPDDVHQLIKDLDEPIKLNVDNDDGEETH